jgi:hypothetical protein
LCCDGGSSSSKILTTLLARGIKDCVGKKYENVEVLKFLTTFRNFARTSKLFGCSKLLETMEHYKIASIETI